MLVLLGVVKIIILLQKDELYREEDSYQSYTIEKYDEEEHGEFDWYELVYETPENID